MRFPKSFVLAMAAGAGVVLAQTTVDPNTLPACAATCLANMQAKFGDFACASADDFLCLCRAPAWRDGIASCATGTCGGEQTEGFQQVTAYANEKCAIVTGTPSVASSTTSASQSAPPETSSTPPASTTVESTSAPPSTTDTAATASTSSTPTTLLTSTKPAVDSTSSDAGSKTNTANADAAEASNTPSDNTDGDGDSSGNGISTGAKIGIAVGAGAAGMILLALLIALCCRRRDRKTVSSDEKSIRISSPMAGSGRSYASDDGSPKAPVAAVPFARSKGGGKSELELTSTRYENMIPRTQPSLTDARH